MLCAVPVWPAGFQYVSQFVCLLVSYHCLTVGSSEAGGGLKGSSQASGGLKGSSQSGGGLKSSSQACGGLKSSSQSVFLGGGLKGPP